MHTLYVLSVWCHILAACAWVGGMMFLIFALVPSLRGVSDRRVALQMVETSGKRFKKVGWFALSVLIVTGFVNLYCRGYRMDVLRSYDFWRVGFGHVLGIKLVLVGCTLALSAVHDFLVGPRAVEALRRNPDAPAARKLRAMASWMGRINFLLALAAVLFGVMLVRGAL
jgi:uncharacterized membrane protein